MLGKWKQLFRRDRADSSAIQQAPAQTISAEAQSAENIHLLYTQWLLQDFGEIDAPLSVPEKLVSQAVEQQLRDYAQRAAAVPRLPTVIPLLLKQLRDPLASAREYAGVITQDPVIATAVLKVANSVYFNPYRKPLDNFERVINDLGVLKLRMILSAAVMQPVLLDRHNVLPQKIWKYSLICAACCQQLADREGVDSFRAYMTGLVHDIGVVTLFNQTQLSSREYLQTSKVNAALLNLLFAQWAKPLAHWVAQDWNLPADIVRALAAQYEPGPGSALAQILRRANRLCEAFAVYRSGQMQRDDVVALAKQLQFPDNIISLLESSFGEDEDR